MTYSCTDFAGSIQDKLTEVGALHPRDKEVDGYEDDPGAQATASLDAIDRLVEVRDAVLAHRAALAAWEARDIVDENRNLMTVLGEAEARLGAALANVAQPA
jgi:hypothetical protein